MCVENHMKSSRKRVKNMPFNLIGVRPIWRWRSFVVKRRVPLQRGVRQCRQAETLIRGDWLIPAGPG